MITKQHVVLSNKCEGYLFRSIEHKANTHCIIVFHERYGLVQHTLDICARLAEEGYIALAPDLFSLWDGDKEALKRGETRAIVSDKDCAEQLDTWLEYMKLHVAGARDMKFVLMGVCQSGRYPVVVANGRIDIAGCVIFYGAAHDRDWAVNDLQPLAMASMIQQLSLPMLLVFAERDHTISMENVSRIRATVEAANISYRMRIVPEVPHGFLNDTMPGRYRADEAESAWQFLLTFLSDVFSGSWPNDKVVWELQSSKSKDYDFKNNRRME